MTSLIFTVDLKPVATEVKSCERKKRIVGFTSGCLSTSSHIICVFNYVGILATWVYFKNQVKGVLKVL